MLDQVSTAGELGDFRLELLKTMVEVSPYVTEEAAKDSIDTIYSKLRVSI